MTWIWDEASRKHCESRCEMCAASWWDWASNTWFPWWHLFLLKFTWGQASVIILELHPSTLSSPLGESSRSEGTTSRYPSKSSGVPQDSGTPNTLTTYQTPLQTYNWSDFQQQRKLATRSNSVLSVSWSSAEKRQWKKGTKLQTSDKTVQHPTTWLPVCLCLDITLFLYLVVSGVFFVRRVSATIRLLRTRPGTELASSRPRGTVRDGACCRNPPWSPSCRLQSCATFTPSILLYTTSWKTFESRNPLSESKYAIPAC